MLRAGILLLLLAGVLAKQGDPIAITFNVGDNIELSIDTEGNATNCFLVTPDEKYQLMPVDTSGNRFEIGESNTNIGCAVKILNAALNDTGIWELYTVSDGVVIKSQRYDITVNASGGLSSGTEPLSVSFNVGDNMFLSVITINAEVAKCFLVTPEEIIQLLPEDKSGDRYEVRESNAMVGCSVDVRNAVVSDNGKWELYTESADGVRTTSQQYEITVNGDSSDLEDSDEDDDAVFWFPPINHSVRTGSFVTITLSKMDYRENCSLQKPNGTFKSVEDLGIDGERVSAYGSTIFVACRVVIGPIDSDDLLGTWTLCGDYTDDEASHKRCQQAMIQYHNPNLPDANWRTQVVSKFDHAVHFGGILNTGFRGEGQLLHCHVVTPLGEDIVLTSESNYPYLNASEITNDRSICNVLIGPIRAPLLGDWVVYAYFQSTLFGYNEVRQPLYLFLYDEENPYDQAYNVTNLESINRVVNIGNTIVMEVSGTGTTNDCIVQMPTGEEYSQNDVIPLDIVKFLDTTGATCVASIGPITENVVGDWQLSGKFYNRGRFTELRQPFKVIKEDPSNPLEEDRRVSYLTPQQVTTRLGVTHRVTIGRSISPVETCHIRTPSNMQYKIMEGFNVSNVEVLTETSINCGVTIKVVGEEQIGTWTLISREEGSMRTERRFQFTVNVEEEVGLVPIRAVVAEGNDLYIRLAKPTDLHETCELIPPTPMDRVIVQDTKHINECGYIVRSVTDSDDGEWKISYGRKIIYVGVSTVAITERPKFEEESYAWVKDRAVNQFVGPEEITYCMIEDQNGAVWFDGFGRCFIEVGRVTTEHAGKWSMTIARPGRVLTEKVVFTINVDEPAPKARVKTFVEKARPVILLTCTVEVQSNVTACKFRNPSGQVLIAADGVGEDRYIFHGSGARFESEVRTHECGLRIQDPTIKDLGFWRCAMETERETYYGFLAAFCPWAQPEEHVPREPTLTPRANTVTALERDAVTMACSVQSPIEYCYFRSPNGTIFSVNPSITSTLAHYVGDGFDAGDCGIRFHDLTARDSGLWSCHVGFPDMAKPEQRQDILLNVEELLYVRDELSPGGELSIFVRHGAQRPLDYCRFVRSDGLGFTAENAPMNYYVQDYGTSYCNLNIPNPSAEDMRPWTVAVRVRGQQEEIYKVVSATIIFTPPSLMIYFWLLLASFSALMLLFVILRHKPKKCRDWMASRASHVRVSLRKHFWKEPLITLEPETKEPQA